MSTRIRRRHPGRDFAFGLVLLAALTVFLGILAHPEAAVAILLGLGIGGVAVYAALRRALPPQPARPGLDEPAGARARLEAERDRLTAEIASNEREIEDLKAQLRDAKASAAAAWDAASSAPPRPRQEPGTARDRLARTPMSGAHDLTGGPR